jgi:phage terminase large subunit GpA-like protein
MLTETQLELRRLEREVGKLFDLAYVGDARQVIRDTLDVILPPETISTHDAVVKLRKMPTQDGQEADYDADKFPYSKGIEDTCDEPTVEAIPVQGPARSAKTTAAESHLFKRLIYGPSGEFLWYMQSEEDLEDYIEQSGEPMLLNHPQIANQIKQDRRMSRTRKRIGNTQLRYLPATARTMIGKKGLFVVADEIDAWGKRIRSTALTKLRNRMRDYGSAALLYIASHPDAGPTEGVSSIISESLRTRHLWWWQCIHCGKASSPAAEAKTRMNWNVAKLLEQAEGMDLDQIQAMVQREVALICPHCQGRISDEDRLLMSRTTGAWLQQHQEMMDDGEIAGERIIGKVMGFVIHAFMSPLVNLPDLASEFVVASIKTANTGDDTGLKEVICKSLGEVYEGSKAEERIEEWDVVKNRLTAKVPPAAYARGTVPPGVLFITAFADAQEYGWECRVIGWGRNLESWLIDAYAIKQWDKDIAAKAQASLGVQPREFGNLKPATRLEDWLMLEYGLLDRMFPLADRPGWYLPVAKIISDNNGRPGLSNMGRVWLSNLKARGITVGGNPFSSYRVQLTVGAAHTAQKGEKVELYGVQKNIAKDDLGKPLPIPVTLIAPDVTTIKRMIAVRMKVENPAEGGMMHLPYDLPETYVRELVSEKFINGSWVPKGRNETWDGWVAAEVARHWLQPERKEINWNSKNPEEDFPEWAAPVQISPQGVIVQSVRQPVSQWAWAAEMNAAAGSADFTV